MTPRPTPPRTPATPSTPRTFLAALAGLLVLGGLSAAAQTPPSLDAFGLLVAEQSRPSFSLLGAGARAAGMGGAFTALADDASAASFNPAGLALLERPEASLAFDARSRDERHAAFTDVEGGEVESYGASTNSFDAQAVNFASFTVPFTVADRNLAFQISYHRPIDFTFAGRRQFTETVAGTPLADLLQTVDQDGDVTTLSLAAGYQVTPRMSLGLTLTRWSAGWDFATRTVETGRDGEVRSLRFGQRNDWSGWNVTGGVLLRYRYLNVGAALRSGFDGDFGVSSSLATDFATPFPGRSRSSGTLHWPGSWTFGLAGKPTDTWVVTADYAEYDWDDFTIEGVAAEPVNFFDLRPVETTTARHAGQWRFGTERTFFPRDQVVAVRAGYSVEPRPQLLAPDDEKSSLQGISAGVGWTRGPVSVDLAYQRASSTSRVLEFVDPETVATGTVESQAQGRVRASEERLFVSLLYQFESRAALGRLFRFLFVGPARQPAQPPAHPKAEADRRDDG